MLKRVYCCRGIVTKLLLFLFLIIALPICVRWVKVSAAIDNTDNTPPVIHNISIDKAGFSVAAGDEVKIKAKVTDDKTKVASVRITFSSYISNDSSGVSLTYNSITDEFEGVFSVKETMQAGLWYFDYISASDQMGNNRYYNQSSIPFDTSEVRFVVLKNGVSKVNPYYIELGKSSISLTEAGETVTIPATVLPRDAVNKNIVWVSDNPSVATVTGSAISAVTGGAITAVTNGKAKIIATTVDGGIQAYCDVIVNFINGIQINREKVIFTDIGSSDFLNVTTLPDNKSVQGIIWESSNPSVATVDQYGRVQSLSYGRAIITAKTANGKHSDSCEVIVNIISQISLNKDTIVFNKLLSSERLQVTVVPEELASNAEFSWSSSDSSIVEVYNGLVRPRKKGTATITVKTRDGRLQNSCIVTVDIPEGIDNTDIEAPVIVSAKIDEAGEAVKAGDTIHIRIKATDDKSEITSININLASKTTNASRYISIGDYFDETNYDIPSDEYLLSFTIDDKMVVGLWYCASIQVTDMMDNRLYHNPYRLFPSLEEKDPKNLNYFSKEDLRFIVLKNDGSSSIDSVQDVEIKESMDDTVYTFKNKGETITLHADVLPITAKNKSVVWSSSDSSKATVDASGKVTAISNGLVTITATTVEGGFTSSCSVYVSIPKDQDNYTPSPGGSSSPGGSYSGGTGNNVEPEENSSTSERTITEGEIVTTIRTTEKKDKDGILSVTEEKTITDSIKGISLVTIQTTTNQTAITTIEFSKPEVGIVRNTDMDDEGQNDESKNKDKKHNPTFIRMEFPTELLMKEKDTNGEKVHQVKTTIPTETVIEQIKSNDNSSLIVEYIIDSELLNGSFVNISELLMENEILEAVKESDKSITISIKDEQGNESFSWTFDGNHIGEAVNDITDMNLALRVVDIMDNKVTSELLGKQDNVKGTVLNLEATGTLPSPASLKVFIGDQQGLKLGEKAYVYIADPVTGMLKSIVGGHGYRIDSEGYITLNLLENANYVILPEKADSDIILSLRDQISVNENMTIKSGDKDNVTVSLPESLKLGDRIKKESSPDVIGSVTIKYVSSDESVIKINEKSGEIVAVSSGKAIINIEVTLYSGKVKVLATEIEVVH